MLCILILMLCILIVILCILSVMLCIPIVMYSYCYVCPVLFNLFHCVILCTVCV